VALHSENTRNHYTHTHTLYVCVKKEKIEYVKQWEAREAPSSEVSHVPLDVKED